jgi:hypothetical protein
MFTPAHAHAVAAEMRKVQNDTTKMVAVLHLCEMFQRHDDKFRAIDFYKACGMEISTIIRLTTKGLS